jgi:hypothetical protein
MSGVDERVEEITRALRAAGELRAAERIVEVLQLSGGWSRHAYVATGDGQSRATSCA